MSCEHRVSISAPVALAPLQTGVGARRSEPQVGEALGQQRPGEERENDADDELRAGEGWTVRIPELDDGLQ